MPVIRLILILYGAFILGKGFLETRQIDAVIIERWACILIFSVGAALLLGGIFLPLICVAFRHSVIVRILSVLAGAFQTFLAATGIIIAVYPLTVKKADGTEPYVLVPGAPVIGNEPTFTNLSRGKRAGEWLNQHPDSIAVLSGGKGGARTEAETLRDQIMAMGVSGERLICENEATTTDENFQNCMPYLKADAEQRGLKGNVADHMAVLTNHFHIFRLHYYTDRLGYPNMHYIVTPTPFNVSVLWYGREIMLTVRYWFTGL